MLSVNILVFSSCSETKLALEPLPSGARYCNCKSSGLGFQRVFRNLLVRGFRQHQRSSTLISTFFIPRFTIFYLLEPTVIKFSNLCVSIDFFRHEHRKRTINVSVPNVKVLNISVQDNPAKFGDSYTFDITFECLEQLSKGTHPPSENTLLTRVTRRPRMETHVRRLPRQHQTRPSP
jgi:hypothetical protein